MFDHVSPSSSGADIPLWWAFLISLLAAVSGEAYRADQERLGAAEIIRRIVCRSSAAAVLAVCTLWLALSWGAPTSVAGALAGIVALAGADVTLAIYLSILRKRLGINSQPVEPK